MVWEASQKGVPSLGVPGNSLKMGLGKIYQRIFRIEKQQHSCDR